MKNQNYLTASVIASLLLTAISADAQWTRNAGTGQTYTTFTGDSVGIGTINPKFKLDIQATGIATMQFKSATDNASILLDRGASNKTSSLTYRSQGVNLWQTGIVSNNNYTIRNNGTASVAMFFDYVTNDVGIGTTTPSNRLTVNGNANFTGFVGIGVSTPNAPLQFANAVASRMIVLYETANNDHQYYGLGINGYTFRYQVDALLSDHVFYAAASSTSSNELMRIKGNGNVGIGTATPGAKLEVAGNIKITDGTQGAGKVLTSDLNGLATWQTPTGGGWGLAGNAGTTASNFIGTTDNKSFRVRTNNTVKMIIDSLGNVGIGTSTPAAKLDVRYYGPVTVQFKSEDYHANIMLDRGISNGMASLNYRTLGTTNWQTGLLNNGNYTIKNFNTSTDVMTIDSATNNVGIGTTTPSEKLEVDGNIKSSGFVDTQDGYYSYGQRILYADGSNTFVGTGQATANSGLENTAVGRVACNQNTTGNDNTANGFGALYFNTTGSKNTASGSWAGAYNVDGNYNTFIGYFANPSTGNLSNATAIGNNAYVGASNSLILGSIKNTNGATANTKVGIGTSTPGAPLHIICDTSNASCNGLTVENLGTGTNNSAQVKVITDLNSSSDPYIAFVRKGKYGWSAGLDGNSWDYKIASGENGVGGSTAFVITDSSKRVGIGTATPGVRLEVVDNVASGIMNIRNNNIAGYSSIDFKDTSGNSQLGIGYANSSAIIMAGQTYIRAYNTNLNLMTLNQTRMTITTAGNVGIGTTSPSAKLDVTGNVKITDGTQGAGKVLTSDANGLASWQTIPSGGSGWALSGNLGTTISDFLGTTDNRSLRLKTNNIEKMIIDSVGNVGIGNNTPFVRLHVESNSPSNWVARFNNTAGSTTQNNGILIQAGNNGGTGSSSMLTFFRPDITVLGGVTQISSTSVLYSTTSDKRLKENIHPTRFGLADLNKIEVRDYDYINGSKNQTGFIAQQLNEIYPLAVVPGGEDAKTHPWMVDYGRVTPLLVKSIQDLSAQNTAKDNEIKDLRNELSEMKQCVESLCNNSSASKSSSTELQTSNSLFQNQPNPFNQSTVISYQLSGDSNNGRIIIRDLNGNLVKQFSIAQSGKGQVTINANTLAQGTYTYTLEINGESVDTKLMVVTK